MTSPRNGGRHHRRGMTSVAVLVSLVLLLMMGGVLLRLGQSRRDQERVHARELQAEWLAESGLRRALARLAQEPNFQGETWTIPASAFQRVDSRGPSRTGNAAELSDRDAVVLISIKPTPNSKNRREIRVQADYPQDPQLRARHTRRIIVEIPSTTTKGASE